MRLMITLARPGAWVADVVVDADPLTCVRDVVKNAVDGLDPSRHPCDGLDLTTLYVGRTVVDAAAPLSTSGVRDGTVVWLGGPDPTTGQAPALVTLRVVAGPDAGLVWHLGSGSHELGVDATGAVVLDLAPVVLVTLRVTLDARVHVTPWDPAPPDAAPWDLERDGLAGAHALLDGAPLPAEGTAWHGSAVLHVGARLLEVHPAAVPDAVVEPSPDGEHLDYNRPPRLLPPQRRTDFQLPPEPRAQPPAVLPWLTALLPAVGATVIALVMRNPMYLLFAAMSPIMVLGNWLSNRRGGRIGHRRRLAEHQAELARVEQEVLDALTTERADRRSASPDAAELLLVATQPRARLWERRRTDPDHLLVRVGTADLPSTLVVTEGEGHTRRQEPRTSTDVPAALSIAQAGVVGIAGPDDWPRRLARWVVAQLAVLQSPRDVQVYVLTDLEGERWWGWATWLPHVRPLLGQQSIALVGSDAETLARRVAELLDLVQGRQRARLAAGARTVLPDPDVVVVLDGALRLRALPGVVTILQEGPAVGVHCVCVDADERTLPEECTAVVVGGAGRRATLRQNRAAQVDGIRVDEVGDEWFTAVGRSLAPLRDTSTTVGEAALPSTARLLDVLDLTEPGPAAVAARWAGGGSTTRAVVGVSLDGPFSLDLAEHGPHGLVAGTTGSGKSELLQTVVASLAVANRPDAMNFVLVDYKGGAAFKDCVDLPHTVGMVTDLDPHLVQRALTSLGAELAHRERVLAAAGVKDLDDYLTLRARRGGLDPLPRLLIVIDEFASVARELPDFVSGLVSIAQRGRSLGIHLLLATQRPSGVVSAEIRANTNLRIALRVTDAGDSTDVIDSREAAGIAPNQPGRAFARLGHSALIPFQAARVGGRRALRRAEVPAPFLRPVTWADLGRPVPERPRAEQAEGEATDLSVLVRAIGLAADMLGVPPQRRPWLPALATRHVAPLADDPADPAAGDPTFVWARRDLPQRQRQDDVVVDLATFGHLHVAGAPRSGRSQTLRTIAAAACAAASVADLHVYGIDCGNGALLALTRLPHCGAVVQRTETERATRLLTRLHDEVQRRQRVLGEGGYATITEQRAAAAPGARLAHVLLLVDRWEGFTTTLGEHDGGALTEVVHTLLREGASAGVHLVVAGDHTLLGGRIASLCEDKLVLRLADRTDATLAGLNARSFPENLPPGRGLRVPGAVETQVALLADDPSGPAQVAALHALADRLVAREAHVPRAARPPRIAAMPARLTFEDAWPLVEPRPLWALLGVGGDELEPVGADLAHDAPTFLVAGPGRSGRSTLLAVMAESLLRAGVELVVGAPQRSPLRDLAGRPGVRAVLLDEAPDEALLAPLVDDGDGPVVLLDDDAEVWRDAPAREWLRRLVRRAQHDRRGVVLGGDVASVGSGFTGWQADVKKNRRGALLSPQNLADGDLAGARLTRSQLPARVVPGTALVHLGDGTYVTTQVPTAPLAPRKELV
ncbi:cell division FtsK/SpoIIIE [Cellulomonas flavigena DSM 20109]|uniref:Cell division FtsK/SpoIIIE n=1 Tax=Cellulomonas flavigena (strain ATCC 482 / DSM 20109 / BCRC 11376 / JCM 18109 / NBRC 3775 / NCIMB 8073 / NRS 134) TaxID=446466 RepID=D5UCN4_CELFN|nr:FtsK/SpoIIIE domain-containing protein [Cellulomonas flavigena]ADG76269.1 cell division FtsK/SpoIIIE [Cellulomonas flavigena DSM 20109]